MKYIIIENNIVKQIQLDDKYDLSENEEMLKIDDTVKVVCGQIYNSKTQKFVNPPISEEILKQKQKQEAEKKLIKKLKADNDFNALVKFVNDLASDYIKDNPKSKTAKNAKLVNHILGKEVIKIPKKHKK